MTIVISNKSNLTDIDRLGELKAQIADLTKIADGLADEIKALGADGEAYAADVAEPAQVQAMIDAVFADVDIPVRHSPEEDAAVRRAQNGD